VLLDNLSWDNNLDYGNIGSLRNSSFQSFCGTLGVSLMVALLSAKHCKHKNNLFCSTNLWLFDSRKKFFHRIFLF
jgi:hypothetical protein